MVIIDNLFRESCSSQDIEILEMSLEKLILDNGSEDKPCSSQHTALVTLIKIMRNMCAGAPATQSILGYANY